MFAVLSSTVFQVAREPKKHANEATRGLSPKTYHLLSIYFWCSHPCIYYLNYWTQPPHGPGIPKPSHSAMRSSRCLAAEVTCSSRQWQWRIFRAPGPWLDLVETSYIKKSSKSIRIMKKHINPMDLQGLMMSHGAEAPTLSWELSAGASQCHVWQK